MAGRRNGPGPVNQDWLAGGGELGQLIREHDWSKTPLGPIKNWPQSLKTSINLMLNSQHAMWIGWGPEITFLYNDAYIQVLSLAKHPAALGRPTEEVWREIWDFCGPLAHKVFEKGEASFIDNVRLLMNRGDFLEETYYSFSYSPIRDESGRVAGLFCPSTEVTAKIVNARRLGTLSELSANALIQKTTEAACISVAETLAKNPDDIPFALLYLVHGEGKEARLEQTCGLSRGFGKLSPDSVGLNCESSDQCLWPLQEVVKTGQAQVMPVKEVEGLPLGLGQQRLSEAMVLPVTSRGESGTLGVLIAGVSPARKLDAEYRTFYELTAGQIATAIQNVRAAEEERKRVEALAEIDRAKTTFFSNVSHEFRTPLTLMLGPVEELLARSHTDLPPAAKRQLELVNRNGSRLLRLVNTLLDFSRIEAGRMQAIYQPTDLSAFTRELASVFRSATEKAGLGLELDCPKLSEPVFVDRGMWEKIVLNLISNAFKFTFEGKITVALAERDGNVELRVSDTGVGISADEIPRLFDRFHRIENTRSRTHEGSGIGLALVQELVKLHGGSVRIESEAGVGSTFTVSLPMGSAHLAADRIGGSRTSATTALGAAPFVEEALRWLPDGESKEAEIEVLPSDELLPVPATPALSGEEDDTRPFILVADDNSDMRQYLARLLSERYNVKVVPDGQAALTAVKERTPALVLSDVMMPNLDGFGLLRELRSDAETQTIPVILLSARAGEESRVEGMEQGADDYLIKPFSARELLARVQTHLEMARIRKQAGEALRESEEHARNIVDSIADGFMTLDEEWRVTFVNPRAEEIVAPMGKNATNLAGKVYWEEFPGTIGTIFEESYHRARREQKMVSFESFYSPLESWFDVRAYPSRDGISIYFLDITERKMAQGMLAAERNVLEQIAVGAELSKTLETLALDTESQSTDGMLCSILLYDEEGNKLQHGAAPSLPEAYNRGIHGVVVGPAVGSCGTAAFDRTPVFVTDIANDPLWKDFKDLAAAHGLAACCSTPIISGNGDLLGTVAMYYRRPHTPSAHDRQIIKRATQLAAIAIERKQAAEALRHRTAEFETLLNQAPLGVYLVDADFKIREVNPTAMQVFENIPNVIGRDLGEVMHKLWPSLYAEQILKRFRHTLETGEPYVVPEWTQERQDRRALEYYEWRIHRIPLPEGRFGVVAYFRDISRQVKARETIAQSEQRLRIATEAAELGIWHWYPEGDRVTWENERTYQIFERSHREGPVSAAEFKERYCHPEDLAMFESAMSRTLETGARLFFQGRIYRKDGSLAWVEFTGQLEYGADGRPLRVLGAVQDITDRKQAEETVRKSEERLRLAQKVGRSGTWETNLETRELITSPEMRDLFGFSSNAASPTAEKWRGIIVPEDLEMVDQLLKQAIEEQTEYHIEFRIHRHGSERWIESTAQIFYDSSGKASRVVGVSTDITERKRAEETLRRHRERFDLVAHAAQIGFWFCDLPFGELIWDDLVKAHFWLPPDATVTIDTFYERIHPDDRKPTRLIMEDCITNNKPYDVEYRTVSPEGRQNWIRAIGQTYYHANGQPQRFDGLTLDITDRKRVEERERRLVEETVAATAKFRAVFEQTPVFAGIMTRGGEIIDANRLCLEACGYRAEEVLGKPFWETAWWRKSPETQAKIRSATKQAAEGILYRETLTYHWADGTERLVDFALHPIRDHEGRILFLHPTGVDITDFKRVETELRKSHDDLEQRVEGRTQELAASLANLESEIALRKTTEQALRELSARSLRLQDEERRRFARDLHDSTGQTLVALKMTLAALNPMVASVPKVPAMLDDLEALADQAVQEIRTTSHLLHPPLLDEVGFSSAAQWYVDGFAQRSRVKTKLELSAKPSLTKDEEMVFFRILQESLTNVLRHSGSKSVDICLEANSKDAILSIRDYGKGIPARTLHSFHETGSGVGVGLGGMKQRVRDLGGYLSVESDSKGTCVTATLPLTQPDSGRDSRSEQTAERAIG